MGDSTSAGGTDGHDLDAAARRDANRDYVRHQTPLVMAANDQLERRLQVFTSVMAVLVTIAGTSSGGLASRLAEADATNWALTAVLAAFFSLLVTLYATRPPKLDFAWPVPEDYEGDPAASRLDALDAAEARVLDRVIQRNKSLRVLVWLALAGSLIATVTLAESLSRLARLAAA